MPHAPPDADDTASHHKPGRASPERQALKCMIWTSVADEPRDVDVFNLLQTQFLRVCGADIDVIARKDYTYMGQEEYESRVCASRYDLETRAPDIEQAERNIVRTFCRYQVDSQCPSLYMEVLHTKTDDVSGYCTYFDSIRLMDFGIGHLSYDGTFKCNFRYTENYQPMFGNHPRLTLQLDQEKLSIDFLVANKGVRAKMVEGVAETTEVHRLEIAFRDLSYYILVDERSDNLLDLYFLNTNVPLQLWRTKNCHVSFNSVDTSRQRWIRTCTLKSSVPDLHCKLTRQVLGNSSTFCISLPRRTGPDPRFIVASLENVCGFAVEYIRMNVDMVKVDPHAKAPYLGGGEATDLIDWNIAVLFHIGFRMHEQIRFVEKDDEEETLFEQLVRAYSDCDQPPERRRQLENALSQTFDVMSSAGLDPHLLQVDKVLSYFLLEGDKRNQDEEVPPACRLIKRVLITPSRVVVLPPGLQHDNRIIREFDHRCAVSVSFQNEDASRFDNSSTRDYVYDAIGKRLMQGIEIAGKNYQFLACSSSQLREQGCWMYAIDSAGHDVYYIRDWMGVLNDIKHPGRKLARMGQCFSDSVEVDINVSGFIAKGHYQQDIIHDGHTFSDGIGKISMDLIKEVCADTRVANNNGSLPSALQIRFGGCKGMLALDPTLPGKRMVLRMSMLKFESRHKKLEVNKISAPTPLVMNRQVITLLSQVRGGIPDRIFIQLLCRMMHKYADCLLDERVAVEKLGDAGFSCEFSRLHQAGFQFTRDIFFRRMLTVVTRSKIEGIRSRARVEISHAYGRTMLGVLDEYGVLEYGEVFVQYSALVNDPGVNPIILEGTVVVGKMPGLFPGDIRKFTAVNVEELQHHVDVIVFPQKGPRPHPNEISGSDLDGDEYWVTWHPKLIFDGDNEPAADFSAGKKAFQDRAVTVKDLVNFIVDFSANDKVGQIANAHLAWADLTDLHSKECLNLARIHSHVIDFCKTGFLPDEVKNHFKDLLPEAYPDFMDKADHRKTYRSDKVLGQIYRITCKTNIAITSELQTKNTVEFENQTALDSRLLFQGDGANYQDYMPAAEKLYTTYTTNINRIMRRYGIETEEELIGNAIVAKSTTRNTYTRTEDRHDLDKLLKVKVEEIKRNTRHEFDKELRRRFGSEAPLSAQMAKASACYYVAYYEHGRHDIGRSAQKRVARRSFPWLFSDLLVQILKRSDRPSLVDDPCIEYLTDSIRVATNSIGTKVVESCRRACLRQRGYQITQPLSRVIHVLVEWADKWGFIHEKSTVKMKCAVFGKLVESLITFTDSPVLPIINGDEGPLLLAFLRAITDLEEEKGLHISPKILQDLKVSALVAHYQLARHPHILMLTERYQSAGKRTVTIANDSWNSIRNRTTELKEEYLKNFGVSCVFRRQKRGGILHIRGPALSVEEFYDYWILKNDETEWVRKRRRNEEDELALSCSDDEGDEGARCGGGKPSEKIEAMMVTMDLTSKGEEDDAKGPTTSSNDSTTKERGEGTTAVNGGGDTEKQASSSSPVEDEQLLLIDFSPEKSTATTTEDTSTGGTTNDAST